MSPKLGVTAEVTTAVEVAPEIAARISAILSTFATIKMDYDLLKSSLDVESAKIFQILKDHGLEKVVVDGIPCTIVRSNQSKLDKLKFVELGGSLEQLENATFSKPKKPFIRIGKEREGGA